jgi:hypothetical protein
MTEFAGNENEWRNVWESAVSPSSWKLDSERLKPANTGQYCFSHIEYIESNVVSLFGRLNAIFQRNLEAVFETFSLPADVEHLTHRQTAV